MCTYLNLKRPPLYKGLFTTLVMLVWGVRDGAVVRALASHQCCPGSNPSVDAIYGLSLLLVLSFAPRGFSPGTPVFPSSQTLTFPNYNSTRNQVDEEPLCGCATSKSLFIISFIYFKEGWHRWLWNKALTKPIVFRLSWDTPLDYIAINPRIFGLYHRIFFPEPNNSDVNTTCILPRLFKNTRTRIIVDAFF